MTFWSRKQEIENLKLNITRLESRLKESEERQLRLERILKYAKDGEPTFLVKRMRDDSRFSYTELNGRSIAKFIPPRPKPTYAIYLYIDRGEYVIPVTEFNGLSVVCFCDHSTIRMDGDLVYLDLVCNVSGKSVGKLYHFIINYKNTSHVCTEEDLYESETEEQKVETETGMVSEEL